MRFIVIFRISVSNLHKQTQKKFSDVISTLRNMTHATNGKAIPMIDGKYHDIVMKHKERLDAAILYDRDFQYQYFGFKTLERSFTC